MAISTVTLTTIADDTGSSGSDGITKDNILTFSGSYSGTGTSSDHIVIQYSTDGGATWTNLVSGAAVTGPNGTFSLTAPSLADGSNYVFRAAAFKPNNTLQVASSATGTWQIDTAAPTVTSAVVAGDDHITSTGEEGSLTVTGGVSGTTSGTVTVNLYDSGNHLVGTTTGTISGGTYSVTFSGSHFPAGNYSAQVTATDVAGNTSGTYTKSFDSTVCFLAGTMIRTPEGDVAVETLQIGQRVALEDGRTLPVKWIGRQTVAPRFADPLKTAPICIKAGALDESVPSRDLYTSAGHSMFVDGILALSGALVNGSSIVRVETSEPRITYYHVELEEHAIIFANDAPTESFVDNVSRETFDNFADYKKLYGEPKPIVEMDLPVAKSQRQVPSKIRARLAARAAAIGAVRVSAA